MSYGLITDIGICAILLIAVITGATKGFAKQFGKGICVLTALAAATYLSAVVVAKLMEISAVASWASIPSGWFSDSALNIQIDLSLSAEEGSAVLSNIFAESNLQFFTDLSGPLYGAMVSADTSTVAAYLGNLILTTAIDLVVWTLLYVCIYLILKGIRRLLQRIAKLGFFRVADKFFGVIWAAAWAYVIVVGICLSGTEMVLAKWFPDTQITFYSYAEQSALLVFVHNTNFIGNYLSSLVNISLPQLPL